MSRIQGTLCYELTLAIGISIFMTRFAQSFAISQNNTEKKVLALSMVISDANGTVISRTPLNASESGNNTAVGPTLLITIKNQTGVNQTGVNQTGVTFLLDSHVQTGCESISGLPQCKLK